MDIYLYMPNEPTDEPTLPSFTDVSYVYDTHAETKLEKWKQSLLQKISTKNTNREKGERKKRNHKAGLWQIEDLKRVLYTLKDANIPFWKGNICHAMNICSNDTLEKRCHELHPNLWNMLGDKEAIVGWLATMSKSEVYISQYTSPKSDSNIKPDPKSNSNIKPDSNSSVPITPPKSELPEVPSAVTENIVPNPIISSLSTPDPIQTPFYQSFSGQRILCNTRTAAPLIYRRNGRGI
jgi:hypothetical protein